jgi:hypothetical protein
VASLGRPAPEVRQDFACHTSGWPREIRRGLLAAPRDMEGPLAGTVGWVRVGEKSGGEVSGFCTSSKPCPPTRLLLWLVLLAEPVIADGLKIEPDRYQLGPSWYVSPHCDGDHAAQ